LGNIIKKENEYDELESCVKSLFKKADVKSRFNDFDSIFDEEDTEITNTVTSSLSSEKVYKVNLLKKKKFNYNKLYIKNINKIKKYKYKNEKYNGNTINIFIN